MKFFSAFVFIIGGMLVLLSDAVFAADQIILSEVQIAGEKTDDEFVELYNMGDIAVDISGWQLRRKTQSGSESSIKVFNKNTIIPPHGYFLWANSKGKFSSPFADTETSSSPLAGDNSIALFTASGSEGVLIETLTWGKGALFSPLSIPADNPPKNKSLVRGSPSFLWSLSDSPLPTNSNGEHLPDPAPPSREEPLPLLPTPPSPLPLPEKVSLRFNEILPNPSDKGDASEFIELYNFGITPINLLGFTIKDASKTGSYTFPKETTLAPEAYVVVTRETFRFALNNSKETLSLFDPLGREIDQVTYEKTREDVSQNYTLEKWRGSRILTPGKENLLNELPETEEKVPKRGYRGVALAFEARGKDKNGDQVKYKWDFGDGHKSYKAETSHTYQENGAYVITLITDDGNEETVETFGIAIESYPEVKVRIASFIPNPSGKDSEHEWVMLENRGKKKVNLKGFGIATGWKKLSNHPIRDDFILEPKEEKKLTREHSLFTLPNQKGKIELRAPDGDVVQKIKYTFDQAAEEDRIYQKEKGKKWEWGTLPPPQEEEHAPVPVTLEEIPSEEELTKESLPTTETSAETKQVLGIEDKKEVSTQYMPLLNFGTRVKVPENITLSFEEEGSAPDVSHEHYILAFTEALFEKTNSSINTLLNLKNKEQ